MCLTKCWVHFLNFVFCVDCNKIAFENTGICELLTRELSSVTDAEQLEMILEVISSLAENGEHLVRISIHLPL